MQARAHRQGMRILVALAVLCGVAHAQPSTIAWRPPTGCTNGQGITYNTTTKRWQCATIGGVTGSGTSGYIPKFTGASAIGNSVLNDNGGGTVRHIKAGNVSHFIVGDDVDVTTSAQSGISLRAHVDGNNYFDSKTIASGTSIYRVGSGGETGGARTWLTVTNGTGAAAFGSGGVSVAGNLSTDGNLTAGNADADAATVRGDLYVTKSGANTSPTAVFINDVATWWTGIDGSSDAWQITAGGVATWMRIAHASGAATFYSTLHSDGNLSTNGNVTLGDSTLNDTHAVNGYLGGSRTFSAFTGTAADALLYQLSGTFNTAAGNTDTWAIRGVNSATRSSGSNALTNWGIQGNASGGQTNVGTGGIATGGGTTNYGLFGSATGASTNYSIFGAAGTLYNADGAQLGDATGDSVYVPGYVGIGAATNSNAGLYLEGSTRGYSLYAIHTRSGATIDGATASFYQTGTYNTTGGALNSNGIYVTNDATRSSGANNLVNYGGTFSANGGQINVALRTLLGDNWFNVNGGSSTFYGNVTLGDSTADSHSITGQVAIVGTDTTGYFNYSTNQDVYIRSGKNAGSVTIGDLSSGGVFISSLSYNTTVNGPLTALRITPATQIYDHTRGFEIFHEFLTVPEELTVTGTGAYYEFDAGLAFLGGFSMGGAGTAGNRPGLLTLRAYNSTDTLGGSPAPRYARVVSGLSSTGGSGWFAGGGQAKVAGEFFINSISPPVDDSDSYTFHIGLFDTNTQTGATADYAPNGIYCRVGTASSNVQVCTSEADTQSCTDTSPTIAIAEDAWIRCEFTVNAAGTQVDFTVTNVTASTSGTASRTANIPNDDTHQVGLGATLDSIDNAGTGIVLVDYLWMDQTFTTAR